MSEWFEIPTKPDDTYSYDTSEVWEKSYGVYLAKLHDLLAGFALVGSAVDWFGDSAAYDMREFFVLRKFRRNSIGTAMVAQLWNQYPGEWLIRVLEIESSTVHFWRTSHIGPTFWRPERSRIDFGETSTNERRETTARQEVAMEMPARGERAGH